LILSKVFKRLILTLGEFALSASLGRALEEGGNALVALKALKASVAQVGGIK
jgi:hypothetical protein